MADLLFRESFEDWKNGVRDLKRAHISALDQKVLEGPALPHVIDSSVNGPEFDVPTLIRTGMQGKRTGEQMVVHIPFTGNGRMFRLMPDGSTLVNLRADVKLEELLLTVPDNDAVKATVENFITGVETKLAALTERVERAKNELRQELVGFVAERKAQIKARADRDRDLGFPVTG